MTNPNTKKPFKKPTKRQVEKFILNSLIIVFGNFIAAFAAEIFIVPLGFTMGGTTGIGILVRNLIPEDAVWREWAVNITVYAMNFILFVIGVIFLGKKFAAGTLAGTVLYPAFMTVMVLVNNAYAASNPEGLTIGESLGNPLLSAIMGGLLFGLGIGIVVRVGASTGGTDIPPLIFQKYFNTPVSVSLWLIDGFIILLQFVACATIPIGTLLPNIFYGILITLLTSVSIDKVSPIGMRRTQVKIISNHYLEIRDMILTKIDRGVTVLYGQTGYLKEDCHMLLTVISHRQLVRLKAEVEKIDPEAFMTVSVVSEVRGRGFHSDGVDFLIPEEEGKKTVQKEGEGHEND